MSQILINVLIKTIIFNHILMPLVNLHIFKLTVYVGEKNDGLSEYYLSAGDN